MQLPVDLESVDAAAMRDLPHDRLIASIAFIPWEAIAQNVAAEQLAADKGTYGHEQANCSRVVYHRCILTRLGRHHNAEVFLRPQTVTNIKTVMTNQVHAGRRMQVEGEAIQAGLHKEEEWRRILLTQQASLMWEEGVRLERHGRRVLADAHAMQCPTPRHCRCTWATPQQLMDEASSDALGSGGETNAAMIGDDGQTGASD